MEKVLKWVTAPGILDVAVCNKGSWTSRFSALSHELQSHLNVKLSVPQRTVSVSAAMQYQTQAWDLSSLDIRYSLDLVGPVSWYLIPHFWEHDLFPYLVLFVQGVQM